MGPRPHSCTADPEAVMRRWIGHAGREPVPPTGELVETDSGRCLDAIPALRGCRSGGSSSSSPCPGYAMRATAILIYPARPTRQQQAQTASGRRGGKHWNLPCRSAHPCTTCGPAPAIHSSSSFKIEAPRQGRAVGLSSRSPSRYILA